MTLIEAVKTGRRFKRAHSVHWIDQTNNPILAFDAAIADDYIIEEERITLTNSAFYDGVREHFSAVIISRGLTWQGPKEDLDGLIHSAVCEYWKALRDAKPKG